MLGWLVARRHHQGGFAVPVQAAEPAFVGKRLARLLFVLPDLHWLAAAWTSIAVAGNDDVFFSPAFSLQFACALLEANFLGGANAMCAPTFVSPRPDAPAAVSVELRLKGESAPVCRSLSGGSCWYFCWYLLSFSLKFSYEINRLASEWGALHGTIPQIHFVLLKQASG